MRACCIAQDMIVFPAIRTQRGGTSTELLKTGADGFTEQLHSRRAEFFAPPIRGRTYSSFAAYPEEAYREVTVQVFEITQLYISQGHNFFGHERRLPSAYLYFVEPSDRCVA